MNKAYGRALQGLSKRSFGQAMVEFTLLISVLGMILLWALPELKGRLDKRYEAQQLLSLHLQQVPLREHAGLEHWQIDDYQREFNLEIGKEYQLTTAVSDDYAFAKGIRPLWKLLDWQEDFSLPLNTLHSAILQPKGDDSGHPPWLSYLRLSDGWAPRHLQDLIGRPQALTTSQYVKNLGFEHVQLLVSILPFAREFSPKQLRLGFVDADVVPSNALCEPRNHSNQGTC
ncbi:hypothetical protein CWE08_06575 [Aliidiomarina iranensis]|uniref:Uncharacterized protein n=1 Tax=Aliidiomarina iranensis TaxID=1434071 RepID=A0A432VX15_9GAMM|nr:hypothetical protein [Aliidiomarina iranensis]RUO21241.1 hypothetical protein CWE08_06575 [Aliidiomarina iranensis]